MYEWSGLFVPQSAEICKDIFVQRSVCAAVKGAAVGVGVYGKAIYRFALTIYVIA